MEGMIGMDDDWGFLLIVFLVGILPVLLGLVQVPLAAVHTFRCSSQKKGIVGWVVYWVMTIAYLIYFITAEKHGAAGIPDFFLLCYIPAIWFFFAGRVSNKYAEKTTEK